MSKHIDKPAGILRVRQVLTGNYGSRCPFCREMMLYPPAKQTRYSTDPFRPKINNDPRSRSRAHLHARHSPRDMRELWVEGCLRCNADQGHLSLDEWLLILDHRQDSRAAHVREVVAVMQKEGIL